MNAPAYFLFNLTAIHDAAGMKPYQDQVQQTLAAYQATVLTGGAEAEVIEGPAVQGKFFMLRFDSQEQARAWYHSPEYQAIIGHRHASASCHAILLAGLPL